MRETVFAAFLLGAIAPQAWSDMESEMRHLKATLVVGNARAIVELLSEDERLDLLRKDPIRVRELCTWAAECAPIYTTRSFEGEPTAIVTAMRRFVDGVDSKTAKSHAVWARAEVGVLEARLKQFGNESGVTDLLKNALAIARCTQGTVDESAGLLRCVELHLEARHMAGADREGVFEALRQLSDRAESMDAPTFATVHAALFLERAMDAFEHGSKEQQMQVRLMAPARIASLRKQLEGSHPHRFHVMRRHNDLVNMFRQDDPLEPEYQSIRYRHRGLPFAFPPSRHWRVFALDAQPSGRLLRIQRVSYDGIGVGHIEIEYATQKTPGTTAKQVALQRFRADRDGFENGWRLAVKGSLAPDSARLGPAVSDVYRFAIWGVGKNNAFCRQTTWTFRWKRIMGACTSIELRDRGPERPGELTECLWSIGIK